MSYYGSTGYKHHFMTLKGKWACLILSVQERFKNGHEKFDYDID